MSLDRISHAEYTPKSDGHLVRTGDELVKILRKKFSDLFGRDIGDESVRRHLRIAVRGLIKNKAVLLSTPLTIEQQQRAVDAFTRSFSTGRNFAHSFINRPEYQGTWRTAVNAALLQDEYSLLDTAPVFSLNSVFGIKQFAYLDVGQGLPGVFELLDAKGQPIPRTKKESVYYEFGISPQGVVANQISRSGEVIESNLLFHQFAASAQGYGGTQLKRLTGTQSTSFDFSPVSTKR